MYNELVHVSCLLSELGRAIAAWFRSAKLVLEEGIIFRADDSEVVRHGDEEKMVRSLCDYCVAPSISSYLVPPHGCNALASERLRLGSPADRLPKAVVATSPARGIH